MKPERRTAGVAQAHGARGPEQALRVGARHARLDAALRAQPRARPQVACKHDDSARFDVDERAAGLANRRGRLVGRFVLPVLAQRRAEAPPHVDLRLPDLDASKRVLRKAARVLGVLPRYEPPSTRSRTGSCDAINHTAASHSGTSAIRARVPRA